MEEIKDQLLGDKEPILTLADISEYYSLETVNLLKMGAENPQISLNTKSELFLNQREKDNYILNEIKLNSIEGNTEDDIMRPYLDQSIILSEITKTIQLKRNKKGEILFIDKDILWKDWREWKLNRLKQVFKEEKEQVKFVNTYEKGLDNFEEHFRNNLQYILLLPEIYNIVFPSTKNYIYLYSPTMFNSRLVTGLEYHFQMKLVKLIENKEDIDIILYSQLNNLDEIKRNFLNKIYNNTDNFSLTDFNFSNKIMYKIEKRTSKIIEGSLTIEERLHDNLFYTIRLNLKNKNNH